jgi:transposase-like protein
MRYSEKFREKMVAKMAGPSGQSASSLAREINVPQGTLSRWLARAKVGSMNNGGGGRRKRWTPEDKLRVVLDAAAAGEDGLGALLRREGLHEAELARFRDEVGEAALEGLRAKGKKRQRGASPEEKRIRQLEKELNRKEKALAEAAALLVLRKKAEAFFLSEEEGDDTDEPNE